MFRHYFWDFSNSRRNCKIHYFLGLANLRNLKSTGIYNFRRFSALYSASRIIASDRFRCNDMQSQAVLTLIGKCGNRLRLHLSRNPAASSHPRLASPNWPSACDPRDLSWPPLTSVLALVPSTVSYLFVQPTCKLTPRPHISTSVSINGQNCPTTAKAVPRNANTSLKFPKNLRQHFWELLQHIFAVSARTITFHCEFKSITDFLIVTRSVNHLVAFNTI